MGVEVGTAAVLTLNVICVFVSSQLLASEESIFVSTNTTLPLRLLLVFSHDKSSLLDFAVWYFPVNSATLILALLGLRLHVSKLFAPHKFVFPLGIVHSSLVFSRLTTELVSNNNNGSSELVWRIYMFLDIVTFVASSIFYFNMYRTYKIEMRRLQELRRAELAAQRRRESTHPIRAAKSCLNITTTEETTVL